jgi:hypothetical protein
VICEVCSVIYNNDCIILWYEIYRMVKKEANTFTKLLLSNQESNGHLICTKFRATLHIFPNFSARELYAFPPPGDTSYRFINF